MSEPSDLIPLYLDSDTTPIRITGGPHDGQTVKVGWSGIREGLYLAVPPTLGSLINTSDPYEPGFVTAVYRPLLDSCGMPSRDDDGTLVYEYFGQ